MEWLSAGIKRNNRWAPAAKSNRSYKITGYCNCIDELNTNTHSLSAVRSSNTSWFGILLAPKICVCTLYGVGSSLLWRKPEFFCFLVFRPSLNGYFEIGASTLISRPTAQLILNLFPLGVGPLISLLTRVGSNQDPEPTHG